MAGLHGFAEKLPRELSGGMQQRASLCRALLLDPPLLLMDEPFGALDAMTRDDMALELLRIWGERDLPREQRKTVLFVTHSIAEAVFLSDRVVVMSPRPGRIAADLRIDLPRPRTVELRASEAFGQLNLEIFRTLTGRTVGGTRWRATRRPERSRGAFSIAPIFCPVEGPPPLSAVLGFGRDDGGAGWRRWPSLDKTRRKTDRSSHGNRHPDEERRARALPPTPSRSTGRTRSSSTTSSPRRRSRSATSRATTARTS